MTVEVSAQQRRSRVERAGDPLEGALKKSEEKGTPATTKGGLPGQQEYERTQEWWEGYDPGMDAGF